MKVSTKLAVTLVWFVVLGCVAFGMANPELLEASGTTSISGHGVSGSVSTITSILLMTVPMVVVALTALIGFVHHRENKRALA